jgi:hypothetical protein
MASINPLACLADGNERRQPTVADSAEAVAQTIACLDFLYVSDKVTILG